MKQMNRILAAIATAAVLVLLVSVLLGRHWRSEAGRKADELRQAQARYSADSTAFVARMAQLEESLTTLNTIGDSLRAGWLISREASGAAIITIRNLIARLPVGDRGAANVAIGTIIGERQACTALVSNCEARVATERTAKLEALAQLHDSDSLRTATSVMWEDAERRAGSRWSLSVSGGYGFTAAGDRMCTGATASLGVSYRLARLRLPWPFR